MCVYLCSFAAQRWQPHLEDASGERSGGPGHTDNRGAGLQALSSWHHYSSYRGGGCHSQVLLFSLVLCVFVCVSLSAFPSES